MEVQATCNQVFFSLEEHTMCSDITNTWLVSQDRLSPRAGTSVFIMYNHTIW